MTDAAELVVTAYAFFAAGRTKRQPRFVTRRELAADAGLLRALAGVSGGVDHEVLARGLDLALRRGTLVAATAGDEELIAVNTPANRHALQRLAAEGVELTAPLPPAAGEAAPNIFELYEANIGSLTPLIAEDLRDAELRYPEAWIPEAFHEAAELNKRSWRYIETILKRWETEGPSYEKPGRDSEAEWLARRYREGKERAPTSRS